MTAGRKTGGRDWTPGQSGNPGGRPRKLAPELRDAFRALASEAVTAVQECLSHKDARIKLEAARIVFERGWGKVPDAPKPGDDAHLIEGKAVETVPVPLVPKTAEEWAAKHGGAPSNASADELASEFDIKPPSAPTPQWQPSEQPAKLPTVVNHKPALPSWRQTGFAGEINPEDAARLRIKGGNAQG